VFVQSDAEVREDPVANEPDDELLASPAPHSLFIGLGPVNGQAHLHGAQYERVARVA